MRLADEDGLEINSVEADCRSWLWLSEGGEIKASKSVRLNNATEHIPLFLAAGVFIIL